MKQLTMLDATFLYNESKRTPQNATMIWVYDRSTARGAPLTFEDIHDHIVSRAHQIPVFRKRVMHVPGDIDLPWWVDDPNFCPERHVYHVTLPPPGDWQQLREFAGRVHSRCVDLSRPLWEIHVVDGLDDIEGVPSGAFALVMVCHHAAMDGRTSVIVNETLNSTQRTRQPTPVPAYSGPEAQPNGWKLLSRGGRAVISQPARTLRALGKLAPYLVDSFRDSSSPDSNLPPVPETRFSGRVSSQLEWDACYFDLAEVKAVRKALPGATLNDIAMAVFAGAMREYLLGHGELPEAPLRSMFPMALPPTEESSEPGNELAITVVNMGTDIADPLERVKVISASTGAAKASMKKYGLQVSKYIQEAMPGMMVGPTARLSSKRFDPSSTGCNTAVSNVVGPSETQYLAGCELVRIASAVFTPDGQGLINYMTTYTDQAHFGYTCCAKMMPDSDRYTDCIRESFHDLCVRTGVRKGARKKQAKRVVPKQSRSKKSGPEAKKKQAKRVVPKQSRSKKTGRG